ncbi:MAG: GNAT family N-acetyltransferase [Bacteroidia bacterium]|jgi:predicted GNAT family N-acyltransferase|nr:GNAT family N-acetyltransferase [Bacteroidia bacterium]
MIRIERIQSPEILAQAHQIRKLVFVMEQGCPESVEWEFEEESVHYAAFVNEVMVGTARWRMVNDAIKLERFAILKSFRGQKVGQTLLLKLLHETESYGLDRVLHAQIEAVPFYLKNGFVAVGPHFWEAGIEHVKMKYVVTEK